MANVTIRRIQGQGQFVWIVHRGPSGRWVAVCDPMKLVTEADSLDELYSVIDESMQLLLIDIFRDNELDRYLRELGWQAVNLPRSETPEEIQFDVPWELIVSNARDSARRAY